MKNVQNGRRTVLAVLMATVLLVGCATTDVKQSATINKIDPYENANRGVYQFNDTVDDYVAKPISDAYKWVTPQLVQTSIFNFFNNLKNVNVIINDALQAKFAQSGEDTARLLMNSTIGLGGLIDVAKEVGLAQHDEDFDQTLAVWGVPTGPYLIIPLLGPTTVRGIPGAIFDTAANPTTYVGMPVQLVSMLNARANAQSTLDFVHEGALDPYVFIREGFLQNREHLATDGKSQAMLDIDDELDTSSGSHKHTPANKPKHALHLSESNDQPKAKGSFVDVSQSLHKTADLFSYAQFKIGKINDQRAELTPNR